MAFKTFIRQRTAYLKHSRDSLQQPVEGRLLLAISAVNGFVALYKGGEVTQETSLDFNYQPF
jgi:hypothetical protein